MSTQAMLTESELSLREKVQDFVAGVPRQLLLDMDADKVRYPKEFLQEAGKRRPSSPRFPASCKNSFGYLILSASISNNNWRGTLATKSCIFSRRDRSLSLSMAWVDILAPFSTRRFF